MEKRKLAKIPREEATDEMVRFSERAAGTHIVTTKDIEKDLLMVTFYPIRNLKKGEKSAQLRTFFSKNDYISQDLTTEKVKWLTAAYDRMYDISLYEHHWDYKESTGRWTPNMFFWTDADIDRMRSFFKEWSTEKDVRDWTAVTRFQDMVRQKRLDERHAKETNPIDALMETVKEIPDEFKNWVSEKAMSFSRYLIYSTRSKNEALVHCTHCNGVTRVDRTKIRLRNNEKGICPLCGSSVTIKARGRMPAHIYDRRIVSFIEPREEGFLWRYFTAHREVKPDGKINDGLFEIVRTFYKFAPNGTPYTSSYEYREYKQTGIVRWCTDEGYRESSYCTLYPGNLPEAWKDTPMKYSALEIFICCFTKQAQPDFKGILMDSTMILFDAKHTDKDKISRDVVTTEQQACFERYMKLGAMCFLVVSLEFKEFYRVPWVVFRDMKKIYGHKYMNREELEPYRIKYSNGVVKYLDGIVLRERNEDESTEV